MRQMNSHYRITDTYSYTHAFLESANFSRNIEKDREGPRKIAVGDKLNGSRLGF